MRYEELNWMDVEAYLQRDQRLMLVLGACEQHGYLSLLTDSQIPLALADAASERTGVLVAPALNFGASPYFLSYPGTISLRTSTLLDVAEDLVRSVYGQGFRRLVVLNGHSGNEPVKNRLVELINQLPGLEVRWYSWWLSHTVEDFGMRHGLKEYHGGWMEAFSFTRVADLPEGDKAPPHVTGVLGAQATRAAYGDGMFGGRYTVAPALMDELFSEILTDVLHLLDFS